MSLLQFMLSCPWWVLEIVNNSWQIGCKPIKITVDKLDVLKTVFSYNYAQLGWLTEMTEAL